MENAARGIADVVAKYAKGVSGPIAVICGPGNNGGDGFAAARHLHNLGLAPHLHLVTPPEAFRDGSDAGVNLAIARAMGIPVRGDLELQDVAVVVDALFGTGLSRPVRAPYNAAIEAINAAARLTIAVDLPSGLDADTGEVLGVAVRAHVTATMVAPKVGFAFGEGPTHVGEVVVVDIGCPRELIDRV